MQSDPIADFLTRIEMLPSAGNEVVLCPHSKMKEAIGAILEREGFIEKSRIDRSGKFPFFVFLSKTESTFSC